MQITKVSLSGILNGTETFNKASLELSERQRIRNLIGDYSEFLVYVFCMGDRKRLLLENQRMPFTWVNRVNGEKTEISCKTLCDLVELEAANYVEQLPFGTVRSKAVFDDMSNRFEAADGFMSVSARVAVAEAIATHVHDFSVSLERVS